jgi:hypothetical protein
VLADGTHRRLYRAGVLTGTDLADAYGLIGTARPAEAAGCGACTHGAWPARLIGANAVIDGVKVGAGAIVGAGVVTEDIEPWTANVGGLCRPIKRRASKKILEHARGLGVEDPR